MQDRTEDYDLVRKFISGDEQAFNLIVSRYQKRIYWHARRMVGGHDDADEIVQEVLLAMYNKLKTFNFESALYTWIYKITSNKSLNLLKKNKLKRMISFDSEKIKEKFAADDVIVSIEQKEKFEKMENYLKKLPAKQREIFILRNFDNLSYEEISEITRKSVGTLKANYFHALNKMKEMMDKYEN